MKKILILFCVLTSLINLKAQQKAFKVIPLGVLGGSDEGNLSAYLIAPKGTSDYICLDAGTIYDGLIAARQHHLFQKSISGFLRENIKAYLISHPHLDHVAGLIINSPEDSNKPIYALPFCINTLAHNYFTWSSWANFANEGEQPILNKYTYHRLEPELETKIEHTKMSVTPYLLSHATPGKSTAFLIRNQENYFLYLGDTGDDKIEKSDNLRKLWEAVAPIVAAKKLRGISIECSYPNEQPDDKLFGHLKPTSLLKNLTILDSLSGTDFLKKIPIIVAHIKPSGNNEQLIRKELEKENTLQLRLIFPKQGEKIEL